MPPGVIAMLFPSPLLPGRLLRRYKRFLADIELDDGSRITAHCPNSGSMKSCADPGSAVLLSTSSRPSRKYPHTWELVQADGVWIGINTSLTNSLVKEGIENNIVSELCGYDSLRGEVPYGEHSRLDFMLAGEKGECFVEVKNVTLVDGNRALFPDAETKRGQKHLRDLMEIVAEGKRGVIFFVVQRGDAKLVSPEERIDPEYARLLRLAVGSGVEAIAYQALVSPVGIRLSHRLPIIL
jgi:sugar fermentation stimulation protein A